MSQEQANVPRANGAELHEHHLTKHGLKDLQLAQNRDVHLLALKKLMKSEALEDAMVPEDVQDTSQSDTITRTKTFFHESGPHIVRQLHPTTACTARAAMQDCHATTLPA